MNKFIKLTCINANGVTDDILVDSNNISYLQESIYFTYGNEGRNANQPCRDVMLNSGTLLKVENSLENILAQIRIG